MGRVLMIALASAGFALSAAPAQATDCASGSPALFLNDTTPSPTSCAGYYDGNIFNNNSGNLTTINLGIQSLVPGSPLVTNVSLYSKLINIGGSNTGTFLDFGTGALFGDYILGIHTGNGGTGTPVGNTIGNESALYLINFTGQTGVQLNLPAASNAYLFTSTGAVPEPATWAMMLLGFGAMGASLRRVRRRSGRLLQIV